MATSGKKEYWVIVSSPIVGPDGSKDKDGNLTYKFNVKTALESERQLHPSLILGFDWPASSNCFAGDGVRFEAAKHTSSFDDFVKTITDTDWYKAYKGQVKGHVRACCELCGDQHTVCLVCIRGGPVSQVELATMEQIKREVTQDLCAIGIANADTVMAVKIFDTFHEMKSALATSTLVAAPAQAEEQQAWEKARREKAEAHSQYYKAKLGVLEKQKQAAQASARESKKTAQVLKRAVGVEPSSVSEQSDSWVESETTLVMRAATAQRVKLAVKQKVDAAVAEETSKRLQAEERAQ